MAFEERKSAGVGEFKIFGDTSPAARRIARAGLSIFSIQAPRAAFHDLDVERTGERP